MSIKSSTLNSCILPQLNSSMASPGGLSAVPKTMAKMWNPLPSYLNAQCMMSNHIVNLPTFIIFGEFKGYRLLVSIYTIFLECLA